MMCSYLLELFSRMFPACVHNTTSTHHILQLLGDRLYSRVQSRDSNRNILLDDLRAHCSSTHTSSACLDGIRLADQN
jgi:hypothetical protein